jgi:hypothetical protein
MQGENSLGLSAWPQVFALAAFFCLQIDPCNVMGVRHGMLYGTDRDMNGIAIHGDDGYMLFGGGVGAVGYVFLHFFSAAYDALTGLMDHAYEIAAMPAAEEFLCAIRHTKKPPSVLLISLICSKGNLVFLNIITTKEFRLNIKLYSS